MLLHIYCYFISVARLCTLSTCNIFHKRCGLWNLNCQFASFTDLVKNTLRIRLMYQSLMVSDFWTWIVKSPHLWTCFRIPRILLMMKQSKIGCQWPPCTLMGNSTRELFCRCWHEHVVQMPILRSYCIWDVYRYNERGRRCSGNFLFFFGPLEDNWIIVFALRWKQCTNFVVLAKKQKIDQIICSVQR